MDVNEKEPRIPAVGEYVRMHGTLVEIKDVTPPPPPKQTVYVFSDTDARIEMWANGRKVKDFETLNNFYGKDTCVNEAIKDAQKYCKAYGDGVEIRVVKITSYSLMKAKGDRSFYARDFIDFERFDGRRPCEVPDEKVEVVWSSKPPANGAA